MECEAGLVQLVMSWEMVATLENVLVRLGFDQQIIADFIAGIIGIMKAGPEQFDPHLLPGGGQSLGLADIEDASVLASSIAARVDFLVTNNLDDFALKGFRANRHPRDHFPRSVSAPTLRPPL